MFRRCLPVGLLLISLASCSWDRSTEMQALAREVEELRVARGDTPLRVEGAQVLDDGLGLVWTYDLTGKMGWEDAQRYCVEQCRIGGHTDWRLPTYAELGSLVLPDQVVEDPEAEVFPYLPPFDVEIFGHVFSGTLVFERQCSPWILNLRNGRLFNGQGYDGFVRCVRNAEATV